MSSSTSPTRIAIVQPIIAPTREPWLRELAKNPMFEITVFSLRRSLKHRPGWKTEQSNEYRIVKVASLLIKTKWKFSASIKADMGGRIIPIGLAIMLIKFRPHIIIVTNATELISALLLRKLYGTAILLLAEDTPLSFSHISKKRQYLKNKLYAYADKICAHSSQTIQLLQSLNIESNKIIFTPWAVDNKKFISNSSLTAPDKIKQKFSLFGTIFVTIGSLTHRKGIKNLLEAWSEANKHIRNHASLLVIGDGPERQNLQHYAQNNDLTNVTFTGHLDPEEIAPCLGASDVFVFPTLEDVWGLVANEAMSIGMPIICSENAGCSDDLVINNVNGNTFDPYNTQELAKLLVEYAKKNETGELNEFSLKSKDIISDFTIERSVNTISKIIEQLKLKQ